MPKQHVRYGGRGSGRPQDWFMYGKEAESEYTEKAQRTQKSRG